MEQPSRREIVAWLWSESGMHWSATQFITPKYQSGRFGEVKYDHECVEDGMCAAWLDTREGGHSQTVTERIKDDIRRLGMTGIERSPMPSPAAVEA
jgi:hypothetical protein